MAELSAVANSLRDAAPDVDEEWQPVGGARPHRRRGTDSPTHGEGRRRQEHGRRQRRSSRSQERERKREQRQRRPERYRSMSGEPSGEELGSSDTTSRSSDGWGFQPDGEWDEDAENAAAAAEEEAEEMRERERVRQGLPSKKEKERRNAEGDWFDTRVMDWRRISELDDKADRVAAELREQRRMWREAQAQARIEEERASRRRRRMR